MKATDINIAKYFGTTVKTLRNWKRSKEEAYQRRYGVYKEYFIKNN